MTGLAVALALTGCQRPTSAEPAPPARYQSGADVRDALSRSGLGCVDFQAVPRHHRDYGEEDAAETDTCRVDNQDVSISIWRSLGQEQDWARQRAVLSCQFSADLGTGSPIYVDGGFWTVRANSRILANRIAGAIGGEPRFTDCRSVD